MSKIKVPEYISIRGAKEHNLKNIDINVPKNKITVFTGPSGSGKSSIAFDTIYAEGQRRYVESLSVYARQFIGLLPKADVEYIDGLSPAVVVDQRPTHRNPRSTVATSTEIYDYMRLLFARVGKLYSPATGKQIEKQSASQMAEQIALLPEGTKIYILAPIAMAQKGEHKKELASLQRHGYERFRIDGLIYESDELPELDKNKKHDIEVIVDRLVISTDMGNRLADSVETALKIGLGVLYVQIVEMPANESKHKNDDVIVMSEKFTCPVSGFSLAEIEPRIFSFNSPYGACTNCDGLGTEAYFDDKLIVPDPSLSLLDGAIMPWSRNSPQVSSSEEKFFHTTFACLAKHYGFNLDTPFEQLTEKIQNIILYGSGTESIKFEYRESLKLVKFSQPFEGVMAHLQKKYEKTESEAVRDELAMYRSTHNCHVCKGFRLKESSMCVKIMGKHIGEVAQMTIDEGLLWFENLHKDLNEKELLIAARILQEIARRMSFLRDVGLSYLTLHRASNTLSGGEAQRIKLACQIGSGLSGVIYVLDEPSIGLHQCDNAKLIATLMKLRDLGNTVIVVEHDEETMLSADYLIDMGPGAGIHGGMVVSHGKPIDVAQDANSLTGRYLSGKERIDVPKHRRAGHPDKILSIIGAKSNNLNNITVKLQLGTFITVTGVSGSGKSTFTIHTLYRAIMKHLHGSKAVPGEYEKITGLEFIDKVIEIDQSPIGRTPRSNPATYTGAFTPIRDWFAGLPEAKMRGYKSGRFSFNVKGGRCEVCEGDGLIKIEMHFLPDVYITCDECDGARYNKETLEVKYKGKSIADVLEMTVEDAAVFFANAPLIRDKFIALNEVGLGYMKVGQSATTLSGGEAQRVKLAKELSRKSTGRTLYILDEPTTGLHIHDIKKLLKVLHTLVDNGNTVLVIEHNMDVIKTADYIVDIGPFGGNKGGNVVGCGTPEDIASNKDSITGAFLKQYLNNDRIPINGSCLEHEDGEK